MNLVGSQIEIERIFSFTRILTNLKKCRLQIENLEKLIFINKNWPNDPRIGWKSPSNLVKFLERDVDLKEEFEEFEGEFEKCKLLKSKTSINKILFSDKKLFVTMFVIFSLVKIIIISRFKIIFKIFLWTFKNNNQLISNTQFVRTGKGESAVFKFLRTSILRTIYILIPLPGI